MPDSKYVNGFSDAEKLLKQLPIAAEKRVLQSATMAAARVVTKQIKVDAPRATKGEQSAASKKYKHLYQNIKTVRLKSLARKKGIRGARSYTGNAFWGLFLEFGTRFIAARPWFRPAVAKAESAAVNTLKIALGRGIEREATKLAKGVK